MGFGRVEAVRAGRTSVACARSFWALEAPQEAKGRALLRWALAESMGGAALLEQLHPVRVS